MNTQTQAKPAVANAPWASVTRPIAGTLRMHRGLIGFCAAYWLICAPVFAWFWGSPWLGAEPGFWVAIISSGVFSYLILNVIAWQASWILPRRHGGPLRQAIVSQADWGRLGRALPVVLLFGPFATTFGKMKLLIPTIQPFAHDAWISRLDVWLHGGTAPWQWLAPWLLAEPVLEVLVGVYEQSWMVLVLCILPCAALDANRQRAKQCVYTFYGCWALLGTAMAVGLSCAGPLFYERVVGAAGPYSGLMAQLTALDAQGWLTPLPVADLLWQAHITPGVESLALGISAMPSLHVSMACLIWLHARRFGRVPGVIGAAYFAVIMAGSVALGWHYALDGYVAIAGTVLIWWGAGRLVARHARVD